MDEIQYTYKPFKLDLIKSIHETERCILENQNQNFIQELKLFNMKVMKYFLCVCEIEQSTTNQSFIFYLK